MRRARRARCNSFGLRRRPQRRASEVGASGGHARIGTSERANVNLTRLTASVRQAGRQTVATCEASSRLLVHGFECVFFWPAAGLTRAKVKVQPCARVNQRTHASQPASAASAAL